MLCIQKPIRADDFVTAQKKTGDPDRRLCGAFDRLRCGRAGHYARTSGRGVFSAGVAAAELHLYWAYDVVGRFALAAHCPGAGAAVSGGDGGAVRILAVHPHRQILLCRHAAAIRYLWYKNKKRIDNDRENWVVFQDVHEAIIERAVYEQVQQKRGKIRKRRTNNGEHNMFSGLLVCADCGSNLHFHFNAVWDHTEKLREQYAAELKKVTQLQKQWALRKPVLDAHCLTLQKEILRLEQEVDALVMEKLNGDGGSSAHEIGT